MLQHADDNVNTEPDYSRTGFFPSFPPEASPETPQREQQRDTALALFPHSRARNVFSQYGFRALREALPDTPDESIRLLVLSDLHQSLAHQTRTRQLDSATLLTLIIRVVTEQPAEIRAWIGWARYWCGLSPAEKEAQAASQPATEKQLGFLRRLGWGGDPLTMTKASASAEIERLLKLGQGGGR